MTQTKVARLTKDGHGQAKQQGAKMNHITVSDEISGRCRGCEGRTLLLSAQSEWRVDDQREGENGLEDFSHETGYEELSEEFTVHWCPTCRVVTSFSFNRL